MPAAPNSTTSVAAFWHLALSRPQLLVAHAAAYGALLRDEAAVPAAALQQRAVLATLAAASAAVAVALLGMALMLWAALPPGTLPRPWMLVLVPALPALAAVLAGWALSRCEPVPWWPVLQEQIAADAALLQAHGR